MNSKISIIFEKKPFKYLLVTCLLLICTNGLFAQRKHILFIGDSITDGNWGGGGAKPSRERNHLDQNHLFGSGFMYLSAAYYMGKFPGYNLSFFNRGISGNTLEDLSARWQSDVLDLNPDILSILIGTNDVAKFLESKDKSFDEVVWSKKYSELIIKTVKEYPNVKILLCTPFVSPGARVENYDRYADLIKVLSIEIHKLAAKHHVTLVDFHSMYADLIVDNPQTSPDYWLWDGVHPTVAAHQKMAELWRTTAEAYIIN